MHAAKPSKVKCLFYLCFFPEIILSRYGNVQGYVGVRVVNRSDDAHLGPRVARATAQQAVHQEPPRHP